jgi:hypothetical protein
MTSATIRAIFFPLVFLVLTGCTLPAMSISENKESKLFAEGLDRYITASDTTTLEQLPLLYPQGEWRVRAETILDLADQKLHHQALLNSNKKELAKCQDEKKELIKCQVEKKELAKCQDEKMALIQDNKMLEATLNQLKEVLIDTELKAK